MWLIGRREEIETVLALVVDDWQGGRRAEEEGVVAVREYLGELHGAARRLFGEDVTLDCCFGEFVATERIELENATRQVEVGPSAAFPATDTVADPLAIVKWLKRNV